MTVPGRANASGGVSSGLAVGPHRRFSVRPAFKPPVDADGPDGEASDSENQSLR